MRIVSLGIVNATPLSSANLRLAETSLFIMALVSRSKGKGNRGIFIHVWYILCFLSQFFYFLLHLLEVIRHFDIVVPSPRITPFSAMSSNRVMWSSRSLSCCRNHHLVMVADGVGAAMVKISSRVPMPPGRATKMSLRVRQWQRSCWRNKTRIYSLWMKDFRRKHSFWVKGF